MESIAALSFACNVIQVVQIGLQTIATFRTICKEGASAEAQDMQYSTDHLKGASSNLKKWLEKSAAVGPLSNEDLELQGVATECAKIAEELLARLSKLNRGTGKWNAFKKTVEIMLNQDDIKDMQRKLNSYRDALHTHMLVRLTQSTDAINLSQNEYAEDFAKFDADIQARLSNLLDTITQKQDQQHLSRQEQEYCDKFLKSLTFETINLRQESISEAHQKTCQWIFDENKYDFIEWLRDGQGVYWIKGKPGAGKSTLMNFICENAQTREALITWAGGNQFIMPTFFFWNAGSDDQKSASGMLRSLLYQILEEFPKLILLVLGATRTGSAPRTRTDMRKIDTIPTWTQKSLRSAFGFLLRQSVVPLRICFFLDGLDELQDDQFDILELVEVFKDLPNTKLCVASRPLEQLEQAWKVIPRLRLQDLTGPDMLIYVDEKLEKELRLQKTPVDKYTEKKEELVQNIVDKAEGVFLWVDLVVKELIKALRKRYTLDELQGRLDVLPQKLEDLFEHMLGKLDKYDREYAARCFSLMLTHLDMYYNLDYTMCLLDFALAEDDLISAPLFGLYENWEPQTFVQEVELLQTKLTTRTAGLLEIHERDTHMLESMIASQTVDSTTIAKINSNTTVQFVHRTVSDFLLNKGCGQQQLDQDHDSKVKHHIPDIQTLLKMKRTEQKQPNKILYDVLWGLKTHVKISLGMMKIDVTSNRCSDEFARCTPYLSTAMVLSDDTSIRWIDDVNATMTRIFKRRVVLRGSHWCTLLFPNDGLTDFLDVAAYFGLYTYVQQKIDDIDFRNIYHRILLSAIRGARKPQRSRIDFRNFVVNTLDRGVTIDQTFKEWGLDMLVENKGTIYTISICQALLSLWAIVAPTYERAYSDALVDVFKAFINAGADLSTTFCFTLRPRIDMAAPRVFYEATPLAFLQYILRYQPVVHDLKDQLEAQGQSSECKAVVIYKRHRAIRRLSTNDEKLLEDLFKERQKPSDSQAKEAYDRGTDIPLVDEHAQNCGNTATQFPNSDLPRFYEWISTCKSMAKPIFWYSYCSICRACIIDASHRTFDYL